MNNVQPGYTVAFQRRLGCLPPELVHVRITAIWSDGSISGKLGNECHSFQSQAALLALPKFHVVDSPQLPISYHNQAWRLLPGVLTPLPSLHNEEA